MSQKQNPPLKKLRMGKNCYEKEKLSLMKISDKPNIVFFSQILSKLHQNFKFSVTKKTCLLPFQKMIYPNFLALVQNAHRLS